MNAVGGIGGLAGIDRVMALRQQILERNEALQRATQNPGAMAPDAIGAPAGPTAFADALKSVNRAQAEAGKLSEGYERGEVTDIAKVMLARQQSSVAFEATLQVRNKLLSAYKDIMSMPV